MSDNEPSDQESDDDRFKQLDISLTSSALLMIDYLEYEDELPLDRAAEYRADVFETEYPEQIVGVMEKLQERHKEALGGGDAVVIPLDPTREVQSISEEEFDT